MMKEISLTSSLLIILIIFLGSMNTASALKCYECLDCKKDAKFVQKDCPAGQDEWCGTLIEEDKVTYVCVGTGADIKEGCIETRRNDTVCYCKTDGCNVNSPGGNGNSPGGSSAIPLGQMSLWVFFTLSMMVPWVRRTLFAD